MKKWSSDVVDLLQSIYDLIDTQGSSNILDVGCGDGYDLWQISKLSPSNCRFWGIDSSSKSIQTAQAAGVFDGRFDFSVKDVSLGLPFDDGAFDLIFSKNVLELISDKSALLKEMHRVLKPNGQIIFAHYDWDSQTIDGDDKDFIREMVRAYGDWQQPWMPTNDAWMGRRLWATFNGSQLFDGQMHTYVLTNTEFASPFYGYQRIQDFRRMATKDLLDSEKVERFYQDMEMRSKQGRFFYSITMYIYTGRIR